jgi:tRNA-Thr(GGU) m(6)t(6)A37 methyltransferase TsaA
MGSRAQAAAGLHRNTTIEYRPIGRIHTPHREDGEAPIQPSRADGARGTVELFPPYVDGLRDLEGFSHVILLYHLHRVRGYELAVTPYLDDRKRGLFATRSPRRPNAIGLSVVRLLSVEKNTLAVRDVDMLDGSPLLDIKPYVPEFDRRPEIRLGWLEAALKGGRRCKPSN